MHGSGSELLTGASGSVATVISVKQGNDGCQTLIGSTSGVRLTLPPRMVVPCDRSAPEMNSA